MTTAILIYLTIGLTLMLVLQLTQGSPGRFMVYPLVVFGWPLVVAQAWMDRR